MYQPKWTIPLNILYFIVNEKISGVDADTALNNNLT